MWIIEWSNLSDYEFNVTAWASKDDAFKKACNDIVNHIDMLDPHSDDDLLASAEIINEHIKNKEYEWAVYHWNDCEFNANNSDGTMHWIIRQITAQQCYGDVPLLSLDSSEDKEEETTKPSIIVDDHTCSLCGNTKCSKREKSCWRCGNPI